jgi:DUF971 family protein
MMNAHPEHLDLDKERGLTITWSDGRTSFYEIALLRKLSPSADARQLREEMESNPLTVLPDSIARHKGPITATDAKLIGTYAINIHFSDGHRTGIYTWEYLREIDPEQQERA